MARDASAMGAAGPGVTGTRGIAAGGRVRHAPAPERQDPYMGEGGVAAPRAMALDSAAAARDRLVADARAPRATATRAQRACIGLMLRHDWCGELLAHHGQVPVDFIEVYPENYLRRGPRLARELAELAAAFPITLHAVHHNVAGTDPLEPAFCAEVRAFADTLAAPWISDHLAASAHRGELLHELVPIPLTPENAAHAAARARALSAHLGRAVLLENTAYYFRPESSSCDEAEFLRALFSSPGDGAVQGHSGVPALRHSNSGHAAWLTEQGEIGWLFDVNNWVVNALNFGFDPMAALAALPLGSARELHLGGFSVDAASGLVMDSHATAPAPLVLALLEEAVAHIGPIPVCFEWERNFGSWSQVVAVLERVEEAVERGLTCWRAHASERGVRAELSENGAQHADSA